MVMIIRATSTRGEVTYPSLRRAVNKVCAVDRFQVAAYGRLAFRLDSERYGITVNLRIDTRIECTICVKPDKTAVSRKANGSRSL